MVRLISLLALLALPLCAAHGQQAPLGRGTHVRVLSGQISRPIVGKVLDYRRDSLFLRTEGDRSVAVSVGSIRQLEVGRKRQSALVLFAKSGGGLLFGAVAGALVAPLVTSSSCLSWKKDVESLAGCGGAILDGDTRAEGAVVGGLGGAVIGLAAGLIVGVNRWEPSPRVP